MTILETKLAKSDIKEINDNLTLESAIRTLALGYAVELITMWKEMRSEEVLKELVAEQDAGDDLLSRALLSIIDK